MKNRTRENCTSGSVRDEAGQPPHLLGRAFEGRFHRAVPSDQNRYCTEAASGCMRLNTTAPALLRVRLARGQALQPSWQSPHRSLHDQPLADEKDVKPSIGQTDGIAATRSLALTSRWALSATVGAGSAPCRHGAPLVLSSKQQQPVLEPLGPSH
jgi:hypothetical protein